MSSKWNHTPLSPEKRKVQSNFLYSADKDKDIITISPGIFDPLNILRWKGRVFACDIDPWVRDTIRLMRNKGKSQSAYYPHLNIQAPGSDIVDTVYSYCEENGLRDLEIVDIDLTGNVENVYQIANRVLETLIHYRNKMYSFEHCSVKVVLTFTNARVGSCKSIGERISYVKKEIRKHRNVRYLSHEAYYSGHFNERLNRIEGSRMCSVVLELF